MISVSIWFKISSDVHNKLKQSLGTYLVLTNAQWLIQEEVGQNVRVCIFGYSFLLSPIHDLTELTLSG